LVFCAPFLSFVVVPFRFRLPPRWASLGLAGCSALFTACGDPNDIGDGLIPGTEIQVTDSIGFQVQSLRIDSVLTDKNPGFLFGQLSDPILGVGTAVFYSQWVPSTLDAFPTTGIVVDSVILELRIVEAWGADSATLHTLNVQEITQAFETDGDYTSVNDLATNAADLSNGFTFRLDSVRGSAGRDQTLRVPLDTFAVGRRIVNFDAATATNRAAFLAAYKGLRISSTCNTQPDSGNVWLVDPGSTLTRLNIHYRFWDQDTGFASRTYSLRIPVDAEGFNAYRRTQFQGLPIQTVTAQPALQQVNLFIQAGNNTRIGGYFNVEDIRALGRVAINRAVLELPLDTTTWNTTVGTSFNIPSDLSFYAALDTLTYLEDAGTRSAPKPRLNSNGSYNPGTGVYQVIVTGYVQELVLGTRTNTGFAIVIPNRNISFTRAILGGMAHPNPAFRPRFRVYYTPEP
jgi:hypothetical protein